MTKKPPIDKPSDGGCTCRPVRYRMNSKPMFVHCCHCRWCQRESGASFALNAMIEADRVELLEGDVEVVKTPSASGKGQKIARCPKCRVALWSNYAGAGDAVRFVRVGTLDEPDLLPPTSQSSRRRTPWVGCARHSGRAVLRARKYWPRKASSGQALKISKARPAPHCVAARPRRLALSSRISADSRA